MTSKPKLRPPPGRPEAAKTKSSITIRVDEDIVDYFKRAGPHWRERMYAVLAKEARRTKSA